MPSLPISPAAAATELLKRRVARKSLIEFTRYTNHGYEPGGPHYEIAEKLEQVERGEIDRLMIFMPPRHGKSELASRRFPAWYMGRNPDKQIIAASYNSDLASDFGREVRNIVKSREYEKLFESRLAEDSRAAGRWNTDKGGAYVAAGVGTAVTGRGAHILLIDDPVKDREEAESELRRNLVWNWYTSTAYTRLMPGGAVILIQTRWHESDLGGRLLEAEQTGGDKWVKVNLPAIKDGEALWPERYSVSALNRIKAAIGSRDFEALYQQNPTPEDGTYFQRNWFERHDYAEPATAKNDRHVYITSDFAVTEGDGDFTELGVWGYGSGDKLIQLDWWHGQKTSDVWIEQLLDLVAKWRPLCFFGEAGVIEKAIRPALQRRMTERRVNCRMEWIPSISDKATRARGFQSRASMGKVSLLKDERGERLFNQLLAFPAGRLDDAVDTCSLMGMVIDQAHPGVVKRPVGPAKTPNDYRPERTGDSDWRSL
jgi:predicted phage terminase large subunit-like protein